MSITFGLWENTTEDGRKFVSGPFGPSGRMTFMKNKYKRKNTDPDYILLISEKPKKQAPAPAPAPIPAEQDDDLPF